MLYFYLLCNHIPKRTMQFHRILIMYIYEDWIHYLYFVQIKFKDIPTTFTKLLNKTPKVHNLVLISSHPLCQLQYLSQSYIPPQKPEAFKGLLLFKKSLAVEGCLHIQLSLVLTRHLYHLQWGESFPTVMTLSEKTGDA